MDGAGQAHFFEPSLQGLAAAMKSYGNIVQCRAEAHGNSLSRLSQDVGTPDDIGIVRLERRQKLIEAVAYHPVDVGIWRNGFTRELEILLVHRNLPMPMPDRTALVIGDRRRQDPAEPSTHCLHVTQIRCPLESSNREALQHLLCLLTIPQPSIQKSQEVSMSLDERSPHGRIRRLGHDVCAGLRLPIIMIVVPRIHDRLTILPRLNGRR